MNKSAPSLKDGFLALNRGDLAAAGEACKKALSCEGSPVFWAPEITGAAKLDIDYPMSNCMLTGSLEMFHESKRGSSWEGNPEGMIGAYTITNLRIGYDSNDNWYFEAYAENLFDEFT